MKGQVTARLQCLGWERSDAPTDEVGECTDPHGCTRPGRWTHRFVFGEYCAQHANMMPDNDHRAAAVQRIRQATR